VDMVLGSSEKFRIMELAESFTKRDVPKIIVGEIGDDAAFGPASSGADDARTRAFLKVQDGCDYNCSFCTIPLARGGSRSQPIEDAYRQACDLVANGFREIVITGVNVGDFGKGRSETFHDLLVRLHDVRGLERLRISSIEPNLLTDGIIELAGGSDRMVPHFHVPLQSGSDAILARMRRRYRSDLYRDRVEKVLAAMPDAAIGVDVIVGFPGETDENFQETYDFLHALPVAYLHVFTYSERENTPAAEHGAPVPIDLRRRRTRMLRTLSEKKRAAFAAKHCGETRPVLFEHGDGGAVIYGFTDNYIRVAVPYQSVLANRIVRARLGEFQGEHSPGEIVDDLAGLESADNGIHLPVLNILSA
jgi:threonylcarbamoyladenosine tRNA methylthiotransferase MtaB